MSVYDMTSDDLIAAVKRRSFIPKHQSTFSDYDFLAFADEELALTIVPMLLRMHEDYLLYTENVTIENNKTRYTIPYRAVGNKIREVSFRDSAGNIFEMTRIGVGDLPFYNYQTYNRPYAFYIENNEIVLVPAASYYSAGTSLQISYYMRPNSMVLLEDVAKITSIDRTTGVIQFSNLPEGFRITDLYDLISVRSPNKTISFDIQPVAINTTSKTMTLNISDIPDSLNVGDHVTLATETAIPQIPSDLHAHLTQLVANRCMEALGDQEGLAAGTAKAGQTAAQAEALIDNRVDDAPKKIVNRHSILGGSTMGRRNRFRGF